MLVASEAQTLDDFAEDLLKKARSRDCETCCGIKFSKENSFEESAPYMIYGLKPSWWTSTSSSKPKNGDCSVLLRRDGYWCLTAYFPEDQEEELTRLLVEKIQEAGLTKTRDRQDVNQHSINFNSARQQEIDKKLAANRF